MKWSQYGISFNYIDTCIRQHSSGFFDLKFEVGLSLIQRVKSKEATVQRIIQSEL